MFVFHPKYQMHGTENQVPLDTINYATVPDTSNPLDSEDTAHGL